MRNLRTYAFDWIAWALFAAIPVAIFWQSATSLAEQDVASGGPMRNAAIYPKAVAVIMIGLLILNGLRVAMARVAEPSPPTWDDGTGKAILSTGLFIAYLVALPFIGFHIASPVISAVLFGLLGIRPLVAVAGGVALSLSVAFVFEGLLNVVLPVGVFGISLFS